MNPLVSIDGLPGWLVVTLPIAVLLAIALSALFAGRRRISGKPRIQSDAPKDFDALALRDIEQPSLPAAEEHAISFNGRTVTAFSRDADGAATSESLIPEEPRTAISTEIAAAESAGNRGRLMQHILKLALVERNAGDVEAAGVLLRKLIVIASETGDAVVHAKGRLELGDIAQSQGDLTTACEHWQMARALFDQAALADERRSAETRMQAHGCPTDWVLTDF